MSAIGRAWLWLVGPPPRDGRGRRVHVTFVSGYPAAWWSKIHKLSPDVHRRVRSRCGRVTDIWTAPAMTFAVLAVIPWIGLMFVHVGPAMGGKGWYWWYSAPQFFGEFVFLGSMIWYGSRITARVRIEALLDESICPACRYPMADIRVAADGCTVCPECGAAWKVSGPKPGPVGELILSLADAGDGPAEIARRMGLAEREVQQVLSRRTSIAGGGEESAPSTR